MLHFNLFAVLGVGFIVLLLGVLLVIPTETRRAFKRKRGKKGEGDSQKDWQALSLKLEGPIYSLRKDIDSGQKRIKELEREVLLHKEKSEKYREKLSQEREWEGKESSDLDKKTKEIIHLKQDLKRAEQHLEKEHGQRLKTDRELRDSKIILSESVTAQRGLEIEIAKLTAQLNQMRTEMSSLRAENIKLSKKQDEANFIAKSEYEKMEKLVKKKDKELQDFKSHMQREMK